MHVNTIAYCTENPEMAKKNMKNSMLYKVQSKLIGSTQGRTTKKYWKVLVLNMNWIMELKRLERKYHNFYSTILIANRMNAVRLALHGRWK